jgi:hypothetical protein
LKPLEIELLEYLEIFFIERVNGLLNEAEARPALFTDFSGAALASRDEIKAEINIDGCELGEKERLLKTRVWTVSVGFKVRDDGERARFYYGAAVERALLDERSPGDFDAALTQIKYKKLSVDCYEVCLLLRVSVQQLYFGAAS